MGTDRDDGRVWGRPESLDTLGRTPGRARRSLGTLLGLAAIALGTWVGFAGAADGVSTGEAPRAVDVPVARATCASIGVTLDTTRIPAEGVAEATVVRLSRVDDDGAAQLLVPQAYVLAVAPIDDGIQMSVLVRADPAGPDTIEQVNGASTDGSLVAAVLYDVVPLEVLNECRDAP